MSVCNNAIFLTNLFCPIHGSTTQVPAVDTHTQQHMFLTFLSHRISIFSPHLSVSIIIPVPRTLWFRKFGWLDIQFHRVIVVASLFSANRYRTQSMTNLCFASCWALTPRQSFQSSIFWPYSESISLMWHSARALNVCCACFVVVCRLNEVWSRV